MLRLLMINQDLEIIKVAFTVVAPGSSQDLFDVGMVALLLGHGELRRSGLFGMQNGRGRSDPWGLAVDKQELGLNHKSNVIKEETEERK